MVSARELGLEPSALNVVNIAKDLVALGEIKSGDKAYDAALAEVKKTEPPPPPPLAPAAASVRAARDHVLLQCSRADILSAHMECTRTKHFKLSDLAVALGYPPADPKGLRSSASGPRSAAPLMTG